MSKGALIVGGAVVLVLVLGGSAYVLAADTKPIPPPNVGPPPPPPPTLQQTIYGAGATAAAIGVKAYEAATGSKITTKDIALNVATSGAYGQVKAAAHWVSKLF